MKLNSNHTRRKEAFMRKTVCFAVLTGAAVLCIVLVKLLHAGDVPRITTEELQKKVCSSDLILLDVRTVRSWDKSTQKIKCAKRVDPDNISSWAGTLPKDREIVLYCA
jgi:hypothetical protein